MKNSDTHIICKEECSVANIILRNDKILMIKPIDGVLTYTMDNLKEQYEIFMRITKGIPHLFFSDFSNMKTLGSKEKIFITKTMPDFASACAVKEKSALIRFIVHTSIHIYQPKIPIKLFNTEESAINWLKSLNIS